MYFCSEVELLGHHLGKDSSGDAVNDTEDVDRDAMDAAAE